MKKILITLLISLSLISSLLARPFRGTYFNVGFGFSGDIVMTDIKNTEFFENFAFRGEMSVFEQSDPWNLVFGFDISMINNTALGLRIPSSDPLIPSAKFYSLIRFTPFETGFSIGAGGGLYTPGDFERGACMPMIYIEPSILFASQSVKITPEGWMRLSFPLTISFFNNNAYLNAGLSFVIYVV